MGYDVNKTYNRLELAKDAGVSYDHLYKAEIHGYIPSPSVPLGKRFLYTREEAERVYEWTVTSVSLHKLQNKVRKKLNNV